MWLLGPCTRPRKLTGLERVYYLGCISAHAHTSGVPSLAFFVFFVGPILFSFEVCPAVAAPTAWHRIHLGAHRELFASMPHEGGGRIYAQDIRCSSASQ